MVNILFPFFAVKTCHLMLENKEVFDMDEENSYYEGCRDGIIIQMESEYDGYDREYHEYN